MHFEYQAQPRVFQLVVDEYTVIPLFVGQVEATNFTGDGLLIKATIAARTPAVLTVAKPRPVSETVSESISPEILSEPSNTINEGATNGLS